MSQKQSRKTSPPAMGGVLLTVAILTAVGIFSLLYDRPTVSEIEKRPLASFPSLTADSLLTGSYTRDLSNFFADTFPLREQLVALSGVLSDLRGVRFDEVKIHEAKADDGAVISDAPSTSPSPQGEAASSVPTPAPESSASEPPDDEGEIGVRNGSIITYKNAGYQIFGGSDSIGQWYAQVINQHEKAIGDSVRIYNLVVPSSIEFGLPERYQSATTPQRPKLENIAANLDPGVEFVNPYDALQAHREEYLYFRTDHHWTALGAYYAYTAFAEQAGFEPVDYHTLERRSLEPFLGTLYSQTQDPDMAAHPDRVDYYIMPQELSCCYYLKGSPYYGTYGPLYGEYAKSYNSYSVFLQGDIPVIRILNSKITNGRRIAVVKESFGNAFVPWLVNHYEEVLVIDQRYLERGFYGLLEEEKINELLFINNIFAAYTPVRIQEIATLPQRVYIPPEPESSSSAPQEQPEEAKEPQPER
ncbi:MAG: hypothetical protein DBX44_01880 [Oscillospiraceae bacterium]|nr:MAG: hypothetical protein DBX44_01880 [Oscillospiraceae bacterium]